MSTNIQVGIERQRAVYESMPRPLLSQLAELHGISMREFASIFGISKSFAEEILNHKKLPPLDLALRISRYYEVTVDEMFGWRVDDDGLRRPLLLAIPGTGKVVRMNAMNPDHGALSLVVAVAQALSSGESLLTYPGIWRESPTVAGTRRKRAREAAQGDAE